jgi:predicted ester cyclase
MTVLIATLALGAGCKKKEKDKPVTEPTPGSSTMTTKPSEKPPEPVKETPLTGQALATRYTDCVAKVNAGKFDEFKTTCLSADYKSHEADGQEVMNADAVIGFFTSMKSGFPDWKLEPQLVVVSGRNVLATTLMSGTHGADWKTPDGKELKKTDKKLGVLFLHRLTFNDENKATEEWTYADPMTMMGQLGQLPKEAGPTRPAMDKSWPGAPIVVVTADDAKEKANLELVKKSNETFNTHKLPDSMAMWTDDALESDQAGSKDHKGKKEIEAGTKTFFTAFPDVKVETPNLWAAGDYVVVVGSFSGTHKGPLGPIKPTNKQVKGEYAELVKVQDGKVAELWRFRNGMSMAAQLGLLGNAPKGDAPKGDAPKMDKK